MLNIVVEVGRHLSLSSIQAKCIAIDHIRKINSETKKCSLFQVSISFVIISIITIENIQNTGLNKQVIKYHTAIFFHCLNGVKNLFRFFQLSNQLLLTILLNV